MNQETSRHTHVSDSHDDYPLTLKYEVESITKMFYVNCKSNF